MRWRATSMVGTGGLSAVLAFACLGCGSGPKEVPVFPVSGKVLFRGKPATGAQVVFQSVDGKTDGTRPNAIVDKDGGFKLTTRAKDDGAPAGDYKVLVVWRVSEGNPDDGRTRNVLPEKFNNPEQTPLKATVQANPNELETFELSTK